MSVTLQAAVHRGRDDSLNLRSVKNESSKSVEHLFRTTEKLIKEQTEITGLSTINWDQPLWSESSLLCDRAVRIMKSQTYIFSDSVLFLGGISPENQFKPGRTKLNGIWKHAFSKNWIKLMEHRWNSSGKISQDSLHCEFSVRFKKMMAELKCEPEQFQGRIIFISMFNDIRW